MSKADCARCENKAVELDAAGRLARHTWPRADGLQLDCGARGLTPAQARANRDSTIRNANLLT